MITSASMSKSDCRTTHWVSSDFGRPPTGLRLISVWVESIAVAVLLDSVVQKLDTAASVSRLFRRSVTLPFTPVRRSARLRTTVLRSR